MLFNKDKCKCLHIGQANAKHNYLMNNTVLLSTEREKDVGVVVSSDMKVSEQCGIAARKGNQILGLIRRNIAYRDKRLIIPLYMSLVRPHLEYCIQAWRPHMRKDIDKLERVQRRATRLISEISQLKLYYALARPLHQFNNMGALQLLSSAYIPYGEQALVN